MIYAVNIYNDIITYYIWKIWPYHEIRSIPLDPPLHDTARVIQVQI